MSKIIAKNLLNAIEEDKTEETVISRLIELGRHQGYITSDDLYQLIPDAENDLDLLEEAFAAMLSAGIEYVDHPEDQEDDETAEDAEPEQSPNGKHASAESEDDLLANIDISDTIGLYLKKRPACRS